MVNGHGIYFEHRMIAVMHWLIAAGFLFPRGAPVTGSATSLTLAHLTPDLFAAMLILVGGVFAFVHVPFRAAPLLLLPLMAYVVMAAHFSFTQEPIRLLYPAGLTAAALIGCLALHYVSIRHARQDAQIAHLQEALRRLGRGVT